MGRFRRVTHLSRWQVVKALGLKYCIRFWEVPSRHRRPSKQEMQRLSKWVQVDVERLQVMWLPTDTSLHLPTRLCAHCYGESPHHRVTWQVDGVDECDRHQRPLLSHCPHCGMAFAVPCYWDSGACEQCGLPFQDMVDYSDSWMDLGSLTTQKGSPPLSGS